MSIQNGQLANAANLNTAFASKKESNTLEGIQALSNPAVASGPPISNLQGDVNTLKQNRVSDAQNIETHEIRLDILDGLKPIVSTVDPTATDDAIDGYLVGTVWHNKTLDKFFILTVNTAGAAVWTKYVDRNGIETLTNKTIQGAGIESPLRLDAKQGTEAALKTYATTASSGQFVYATDAKKMFQIIDAALAPIGGGGSVSVITKIANYTAVSEDNVILCDGTLTITLPLAASVTNHEITIKNIGTGVVTVDGNGTETIDGDLIQLLEIQYHSITLVSNGTSWFVI